jgi:hypothetical protein
MRDDQARDEREAGGYIGNEPELASATVPGGVQQRDDRVAGNASQSTGPAARGANPDQGWSDRPEGHTAAETNVDDNLRRKG